MWEMDWRLGGQGGGWWLVQAGRDEAGDAQDYGGRYFREGKGQLHREAKPLAT